MQRKLTAIMAADVVGYSRLMELDEAGTLARLQTNRRTIIAPLIEKHEGRIVKLMGDGSLIEFHSAVNAVACALAIQHAIDAGAEIRYRIGVNLGDVIVEDNDIYGEGVNVAARLQTLAPVGGVAISRNVHDQIAGRIDIVFDDLGAQVAKSGERPIHVFACSLSVRTALPDTMRDSTGNPAGRKSVLVLPFANMSNDPEQEYFSDGITEDIITDLSKVSALSVIARNTAFTFKGKAVDVTQVARQMGVSHVLEGSVRKAGNRVRITGQLIDGTSGNHVWAERYDRALDDIFAMQDEISRAIVDALKIRLMPEERAGIGKRTTENAEAYQYYLMGRQHFLRMGRRNQLSAQRHYQRAIEIDPDYARAHAGLAMAEGLLFSNGDASASLAALRMEADRAMAMDPTIAEAHAADSMAHFHNGKLELAIEASRRAIALDPNLYEAHVFLGHGLRMDRQFDAARHAYERATELDRNSYAALCMAADCRRSLGDEAGVRALIVEILPRIEKAMLLYPDDAAAYAFGCSVLAELGDKERALEWAARAITIDPDDYTSHYNVACFLANAGEVERAIDTLEHCVPRLPITQLSWMAQDTDMDSLRDHPRYKALIQRQETKLAEARGQSTSEAGAQPSVVQGNSGAPST